MHRRSTSLPGRTTPSFGMCPSRRGMEAFRHGMATSRTSWRHPVAGRSHPVAGGGAAGSSARGRGAGPGRRGARRKQPASGGGSAGTGSTHPVTRWRGPSRDLAIPSREHDLAVRDGGVPSRDATVPVRDAPHPCIRWEHPSPRRTCPARKGSIPAREGSIPAREGDIPARIGPSRGNLVAISTCWRHVPHDGPPTRRDPATLHLPEAPCAGTSVAAAGHVPVPVPASCQRRSLLSPTVDRAPSLPTPCASTVGGVPAAGAQAPARGHAGRECKARAATNVPGPTAGGAWRGGARSPR
jgi:hypothetical protein